MTLTRTPSSVGPTWDVAQLYPPQGQWAESDYLDLTHSTNRLAELSDGVLSVLPMPTTTHQLIVQYLVMSLLRFCSPGGLGTVLAAPLRVRVRKNLFREPDVVFMRAEHSERIGEDFWDGADLVMEVVSGLARDRRRDFVDKRREYALGGINEYWIIDPKSKQITVLKRRGKAYAVHADAQPGQSASSFLLKGFAVAVDDVLAAARMGQAPRHSR